MNHRNFFKAVLCLIAPLMLLVFTASSHNSPVSPNSAKSAYSVDFVENLGQWANQARYKADIPGGVLFLTEVGLVYNFVNVDDLNRCHVSGETYTSGAVMDNVVRYHSYNVRFVGARSGRFVPFEKRNYYHNYFIGNDPSRWKGKVGVFGSVRQLDVYPGVDFVVYGGSQSGVKYDFVVAPGSDPNQIRLSFEGVTPKLTETGDLLIQTTVNEIKELAPYCYQEIDGEKITVPSQYVLDDNGILSFYFPEGYDANLPLIIDPSLVFSTYSGGGFGPKYAHSTAFDDEGNTYVAILATDPGWPITNGAYQTTFPGLDWTTAMSKFNTDGSTLLFATFFGGSGNGNTQPNTLRINSKGEIVLAGNVTNGNLPVTPNAYQRNMRGASDIYVARFSGDGSSLLACTYVGGSGREALLIGASVNYAGIGDSDNPINPVDIAFDDQDNVWVTSNTESSDFPVTANAYQGRFSDWQDAVFFKLSSDLSTLMYSSYFGGARWDGGIGIEYHPVTKRVAIVGYTEGNDLPTTSGAYLSSAPGGGDGFAILLNADNYQVVNATYVGSDGQDKAMRVGFDCSGNVYVSGSTTGNFPITTTVSDGAVLTGPIFITKLDPNLSALLESTRTATHDWAPTPTAMMVDKCGNTLIAVISGGRHNGAPITPDAIESQPRRMYFAAFKPDFKGLLFATFFGSANGDDHYHPGVARMDSKGIVYQSVCAMAETFPVTAGSYSPIKQNFPGAVDNITFKFDYDLYRSVDVHTTTGGGANDPRTHTVRGCIPATVHFTRKTPPAEDEVVRLAIGGDAVNGIDYEFIADSVVIPAGQMTAAIEVKGLLLPQASVPDPKYVVISTMNPCFCSSETEGDVVSRDTVWIYDSLYVKMLTPPDTTCPGYVATIEAEIDPTLNFAWTPANMIVDPTLLKVETRPINRHTTFGITVFQPGAPATCPPRTARYSHRIVPYPKLQLPQPGKQCLADSIALSLSALPDSLTYTYTWSPLEGLRTNEGPVNRFFGEPGKYVKVVSATTTVGGCTTTDSFEIEVLAPAGFLRLSNDTTIHYGDTIRLHAEIAGGGTLIWAPQHAIRSSIDAVDPLVQPWVPTRFTVSGVDAFGCLNLGEVFVDVKHHSIASLPDAFTPNGDGKNDVFRLVNIKFEKLLEFKVFNRYGQLVFETTDPKKGWDGTYKGVPAEVGVYFYFVSFVLPDGQHKQMQGDLTLIR